MLRRSNAQERQSKATYRNQSIFYHCIPRIVEAAVYVDTASVLVSTRFDHLHNISPLH